MVFEKLNRIKFIIREAKSNDVTEIAKLHVMSWQVGYKNLLPEKLLNQLSIKDRIKKWKELLSEETPGKKVFVCVIEDRVMGFCAIGPSREEDYTQEWGEIYSIYLHPDFFRQSFGSKLINAGEKHLQELGYTKAFLWVLVNNKSAKQFYEKYGWKPDGATKTRDKNGFKLEEVRYTKKLIRN